MFKGLITATLAAVAGAAMAASSPAAAQSAVGDLQMGVGWLSVQHTPPSTTDVLVTGLGRGSMALGMGNWNLEAQAGVKSVYETFSGGDRLGQPAQADAYAHLWGRYPNAAFGMVFGVAPTAAILTSLGGEIKGYTARASFGAAAAVTFMNYKDSDATGWTLNLYKNFFINPNIRLGLRGAVLTGLAGLGAAFTHTIPDTAWEATLDYEQRLPSFPLSLWVALSRIQTINGSAAVPATLNSWRTEGGIRFFLDQPKASLQSHDRDVPFTFIVPPLAPL